MLSHIRSGLSKADVDELLKEADRAMAGALEQLAAGQQDAAVSQQREAEQIAQHSQVLRIRWRSPGPNVRDRQRAEYCSSWPGAWQPR